MLANAVRSQKNKDVQQELKPLAQQIFSSSPPTQDPKSWEGRNQTSVGFSGGLLLPSSPSHLNGLSRPMNKPFKQPLKRTSSTFSDDPSVAGSNKRTFSSGSGRSRGLDVSVGRQNSGLLDRLHSGHGFEGFEENDGLLSDTDLMALNGASSQGKKLEKKSATLQYPKLPSPEPQYPDLSASNIPPQNTTTKNPALTPHTDSSAPLPWSSSPDYHKMLVIPGVKRATPKTALPPPAGRKILLGRQLPPPSTPSKGGSSFTGQSNPSSLTQLVPPKQNKSTEAESRDSKTKVKSEMTTSGAKGNQQEPIEIKDSPVPAQKKSRTLPWMTQEADQKYEDESTGSKRAKRPKKEKFTPASTPAVKKTAASVNLWEQTASAVKAEQKKFRQQTIPTELGKESIEGGEAGSSALRKTSGPQKHMPIVFLSEEQQSVLDLVVEKKKSVFFTGSAGTGKSVLMREIISHLRKKYRKSPESVAVTASTGLAACNIGGNTLHSFAGIGLGKESAEDLVKKIKKNRKALTRWQLTKVLIIDEISMIDGSLFDKLEQIARVVRKRPLPFGGIQIVITGDFFQLPPVGEGGRGATFAFDASCWKTTIDHTIGLTHVFRQKDPVFAAMLNEMRVGKLTPTSIQAFHRLRRPLPSLGEGNETEATELFPTRFQVEGANTSRMQRLGGSVHDFPAHDGGQMGDTPQRAKLLENCMAPKNLVLKKGAQVMLIKNIDETLVNGSIGRVMAFMTEPEFDYYDQHEDEFNGTMPETDKDFPPTASGGTLDLDKFKNGAGPGNTLPRFPVVRFIADNGSKRDLLCQPEVWKIEQPNGEVLASRAQIPLILAWALSIHKAQGQTLERVKVDLGKTFEKGQAYVALSRATTQEGLQILNFDPRKVMAHEKVRQFYNTLYGVDTIGGMPKLEPGTTAKLGTDQAEYDIKLSAEEEAALMSMDF